MFFYIFIFRKWVCRSFLVVCCLSCIFKLFKFIVLLFFSFEIVFFILRWVRGFWLLGVWELFEYMWVFSWSMDIGMVGEVVFCSVFWDVFWVFWVGILVYLNFLLVFIYMWFGIVFLCVCCRLYLWVGCCFFCRWLFWIVVWVGGVFWWFGNVVECCRYIVVCLWFV